MVWNVAIKRIGTISCITSNAIPMDLTFELLFTYLLSWLTSMLNYSFFFLSDLPPT